MNNSLGKFSVFLISVRRGGVAVFIASLLASGGILFARTASCPCPNPCPCSPCTCGGGGGKSQPSGGSKSQPTPAKSTSTTDKTVSKHHEGTADKGHHGGGCGRGHHHGGGCGGAGVGVSVSIPDGLGARKTEGDPFGTTPQQPIAHTQEKPEKPRTQERQVGKSNAFEDIQLTGTEAKGDFKPAGVNNDKAKAASSP